MRKWEVEGGKTGETSSALPPSWKPARETTTKVQCPKALPPFAVTTSVWRNAVDQESPLLDFQFPGIRACLHLLVNCGRLSQQARQMSDVRLCPWRGSCLRLFIYDRPGFPLHEEIIRGHHWGNNVVSQWEQPYIKSEMERSALSNPKSSWFILNALFLVFLIFTQTLMFT